MSIIHRAIKAFLYPNPMKNAKGKFMARTIKHNTYNVREICESQHNKYGSANADVMEYHVKLFLAEMAELLEDGNKINTGYFSAQIQVKGSFDSKGDSYDSNRHSVETVFSTGSVMRKRTVGIGAEIIHARPLNFCIAEVLDAQTKTRTDKLVINHLLIIKGERIKIAGSHPAVGLYLIHTQSKTEHYFPATTLFENQNATLMLIVPELPTGSYQVQVTTQYSRATALLAQPRTCTYVSLLTVD